MEFVYIGILVFLFFLAVSDLVVGVSNDAVNFLNSAVGAKSARFRTVMIIAAVGVFLGATLSNGMMDIARHGIYQPQYFAFSELMVIMLAVMVTDVILLDTFNTMGLPTSTTVSLVFELLGGTVALAMIKNIASDGVLSFAQMINTDKALSVVLGIFLSIAIAFFFGTLVQYLTRLIFTFDYRRRLKWFAGLFGGLAVTAIFYFMVIKGMKDASFMTPEVMGYVQEHTGLILLVCFLVSGAVMQVLHWCRIDVFRVVVLIGTLALAMAFAGNDLVNFIGIPLAGLSAFQDYAANGTAVGADHFMMESMMGPAKTPVVYLIAAGAVMVFSLVTSKKAKNVISTSVNLSRQDDSDEMFGSSSIARKLVLLSSTLGAWVVKVTPLRVRRWIDGRFDRSQAIIEQGAAFDQLRAAVNLVLASLLIALGTSLKLPLSTTFVTFMVAMGSSLADRAWSRESAVFRVTGMISVIGGWLLTAGAAFIFCFLVSLLMYYGGFVVMVVLSILVLVMIVRSNIRYGKKMKAEKKDEVFSEIVNTDDPEKIWSLLKKHVKNSALDDFEYFSDFYRDFITSFVKEDRRGLKRLNASLELSLRQRKAVRRREIIALRRTDPVVSVQANTWFHVTTTNSLQVLYCMKRMMDPCKEHIDNNFNSLPKECAEELAPVAESFLSILSGAGEYVASLKEGAEERPSVMISRISDFKKEVNRVVESNMVRFRNENGTANLNIYILYQTVLQETQQMADSMKHLLRAYYKLTSVR